MHSQITLLSTTLYYIILLFLFINHVEYAQGVEVYRFRVWNVNTMEVTESDLTGLSNTIDIEKNNISAITFEACVTPTGCGRDPDVTSVRLTLIKSPSQIIKEQLEQEYEYFLFGGEASSIIPGQLTPGFYTLSAVPRAVANGQSLLVRFTIPSPPVATEPPTTNQPTTMAPTIMPTEPPSIAPTIEPTVPPTIMPSATLSPTTVQPSNTLSPTTLQPSNAPTAPIKCMEGSGRVFGVFTDSESTFTSICTFLNSKGLRSIHSPNRTVKFDVAIILQSETQDFITDFIESGGPSIISKSGITSYSQNNIKITRSSIDSSIKLDDSFGYSDSYVDAPRTSDGVGFVVTDFSKRTVGEDPTILGRWEDQNDIAMFKDESVVVLGFNFDTDFESASNVTTNIIGTIIGLSLADLQRGSVSEPNDSSSLGLIVGIVLVILLILVIGAFLIYWFCIRVSSEKPSSEVAATSSSRGLRRKASSRVKKPEHMMTPAMHSLGDDTSEDVPDTDDETDIGPDLLPTMTFAQKEAKDSRHGTIVAPPIQIDIPASGDKSEELSMMKLKTSVAVDGLAWRPT